MEGDGDINLFTQAKKLFGLLEEPNHFTGTVNTFQDLVARRVVVSSDRRRKTNIRPVDEEMASRTIMRIVPQYYLLDGVPAAGVLADEVPAHCRYLNAPDGTQTVDYTALLAELWASTRHLHRRLSHRPPHPPGSVPTMPSSRGSCT